MRPTVAKLRPSCNAAEVASVEAMSILLDHSAEANAQNAFGSTALMWSAADTRKVRLLLERGADVNKDDCFGWVRWNVYRDLPSTVVLECLGDKLSRDCAGGLGGRSVGLT